MLAWASPCLAAEPASAGATAVRGLEGCWAGSGTLQDKTVSVKARGARRLSGAFLLFEVHATDPADPYDAAIVLGGADGDAVTSYWMDSFGPAYAAAGEGRATEDGLAVTYTYPDAAYRNAWSRRESGWRWTIDEQTGAGSTPFAVYDLQPAACTATDFSF